MATARLFLLLLLIGGSAAAQTACALQHSSIGVFICYPNPAENAADAAIPDTFHLSAQVNAPDGQAIAGYRVLIDERPVYQNRFTVPIQRMPIETNVRSPVDSGFHTLRLDVGRAGSAEVKGLQFHPAKNANFCDPFSRSDARVCDTSHSRRQLRWSLEPGAGKMAGLFDGYEAYAELYGQNLKRIEADNADAIAVDAQGNVYAASHAFADVDLRKYAPNGSLIYASLIHSCSDGFLSVTGLAIDDAGHAWIAGNTTACLAGTPNAVQAHVSDASRMHGFVMLVDTAKPGSTPPLYVTYLSDSGNRIAGIRVDGEGNAYVAGNAESIEFPHESLLGSTSLPVTEFGFVAALNPAGSGLLWSTLIQGMKLTALTLDEERNVYVTGRTPGKQGDAVVVELSDRGRRLSYEARFGGSGEEEGRAISTVAQGAWIVVQGDKNTALGTRPFAVALQPCRTGMMYSRLLDLTDNGLAPSIALRPALDAFTTAFSGTFAAAGLANRGQKSAAAFVDVAPTCSSATP